MNMIIRALETMELNDVY